MTTAPLIIFILIDTQFIPGVCALFTGQEEMESFLKKIKLVSKSL